MSIYTRRGDRGETSLLGGYAVSKGDLQVETYGTVDELNSCLGLARGFVCSPLVRGELEKIQKGLFLVAGELATGPGGGETLNRRIGAQDITRLEEVIDRLQAEFSPPRDFVLPGGTPAAGALDLARAVARRAERLVVRLGEQREVRDEVMAFLNRVSDLLWMLARVEAREQLVEEVKGRVWERLQCSQTGFSQDTVRKLLDAALNRAAVIGVAMVVALCDQGGNLVALHRQEGALLASLDIAQGKAYTAAALKMPTHEVARLAQPGQPLYGIQNTNGGRLVIFGGGYPLSRDGRVVGALGVSGGSVSEDMQVAEAALETWENIVS